MICNLDGVVLYCRVTVVREVCPQISRIIGREVWSTDFSNYTNCKVWIGFESVRKLTKSER